jgi:hypothetical protein
LGAKTGELMCSQERITVVQDHLGGQVPPRDVATMKDEEEKDDDDDEGEGEEGGER